MKFTQFGLPLPAASTYVLAISLFSIVLAGCAKPPPTIPPTPLASIERKLTPGRVWRASIGGDDERGSGGFVPFVDEASVYAASSDGKVARYKADSGRLSWKRDLDRSLASGVGGDKEHIYVASREGIVYALGKQDGKTRWTYTMPSEVLVRPVAGAGASAVDDGVVIVRAANGNIRALAASSGEELWSNNFAPPVLTVHGYGEPLLLDTGILVGLEDGKLAALSLSTGALLWQSVISYPSGRSEVERLVDLDANILIDGNFIYAVTYQGQLARIEPRRGAIDWSIPLSSVSGMDQDSANLYITLEDSAVVAIAKEDGAEIWKQSRLRGRSLTRPALIGGSALAVVDFEGYLHLLSPSTGSLIGRSEVLKSASSSRQLVVETGNGASTQEQLNTQQGRVYVQGSESELIALRLKQ